MNRLHRCLILLLLLPLAASAQATARGRVFLDLDGNGRHDRGEPGLAGIKVSNGRDLAISDANGRYRIELDEGDTLFVIKPPHYRFPISASGLPMFWRHHFPRGSTVLRQGRIEPSDASRVDFALIAEQDRGDADLKVLLVADSQVANARELDYYRRSIIEPAGRERGLAFAMTLGDLVHDALDLYPELDRVNAALGIAWLHVPGNHDIDFDAPDDGEASLNYRRHFGPDTVAWEMPGHAFIALDDVVYLPGEKPSYIGGLREDQFAFLEHYLATLTPETRIVLGLHIPLFDDPGETFRHVDRERLFALLQRFREPLVLSGHTHSQRHHLHDVESGWHGTEALHEYNVGAACGGFWSGLAGPDGLPDARMEDGTPNGYAILESGPGGQHTRYHASRGRDELRMRLSSPGTLRRGAYPAFALLANVFAAEPEAAVEARIDEGDWQMMQRASDVDPELAELNAADRHAPTLRAFDRAVTARPTRHLWSLRLPTDLAAGEHRVEVRARSRHEGEIHGTTVYQLQEWTGP